MSVVEKSDDALYAPIQLTVTGGKSGVSCGLADFIAQEEMDRYYATIMYIIISSSDSYITCYFVLVMMMNI